LRRRLWAVFAASLLANLSVFLLGQAAAWYYLRTGRAVLGVGATVLLWLALDWWLVQRFVFADGLGDLRAPAIVLQAVAAVTALGLAFALWRRRWSAVARARTDHFRAGVAAALRGDHGAARATFTRLVGTDPWDVAAWIALGDAWQRVGRPARAKRCWRRAAAVDIGRAYADLLRLRNGALNGRAG